MTMNPLYTIRCCPSMQQELSAGDLIRILESKPGTRAEVPRPRAFLISDSGHGGWAEAKFCPFCGREIEVVALDSEAEPMK